MAKVFDEITDALQAFIEAQPMFFVGTAPSGDGGHVNVSPKGGRNLFRVTDRHGFAYVDLMGSGIETLAHLRENGRIAVMFCAFEGPPKIVRLHGRGVPVQQGDERFAELLATFDLTDEQRRAVRSVIEVQVTRISDSCGFVVPRMRYEGERDQLYRYAGNRLRKEGPDAVRAYVTANNAESIDGLTGLDPLVNGGAPVRSGRKL
jgi:predicted pyridoxine 5'-phosphate oxidase superfamily flavin-nucleotide-binding protein